MAYKLHILQNVMFRYYDNVAIIISKCFRLIEQKLTCSLVLCWLYSTTEK